MTFPVEPTFEIRASADPAEVQRVHEGLRAYNDRHVPGDYSPLYVFLRDEAGVLVGGLLGDVYWGWLYVSTLWIDERYRGRGLGRHALGMAEDEARRRGCRHVHLDTLSFQALPFYQKMGYRVYGALEDFPAGTDHTRYYLTKALGDGPAAEGGA